jgi:hypothetical protein
VGVGSNGTYGPSRVFGESFEIASLAMLKEYSDYYLEASAILRQLQDAVNGLQFEERDQAVEVFAAQGVSTAKRHCRAISLLLDADLFSEAISVCRSLFELSFDMVWVDSADNPTEKLERVHRLEADPYFQMNKEVRLFKDDVRSPSPVTSPEMLKQFQEKLDSARKKYPYLTNGHDFKQAPSLADRMGHQLRLLYYHVYRFMSVFTHPSPMLKELHLQNVQRKQTPHELIEKPLKEVLAYTLLFVEIMAKVAANLIATYAPNKVEALRRACAGLSQLTEKAEKGQPGTT